MPDVYFSENSCVANDLVGNDLTVVNDFKRINGLTDEGRILPYQAYSTALGQPNTAAVIRRLNTMPYAQRKALAQSAALMGNQLHSLQRFYDKNLPLDQLSQINGLVGAGAGAIHNRVTGFQRVVAEYQAALLDLNFLQNIDGPGIGHRRLQAEQRVRILYQRLESMYQAELSHFAPISYRYKNRGDALANADRGITLAKRNRAGKPDARLYIEDSVEASRLGLFARGLSRVGAAALVVDAGIRAKKIRTIYLNGGNWMREGAIQMTGFGVGGVFGAGVGGLTIEVGTAGAAMAAETGLLAAGPIGWAILVVIVCAGLYVGYEAGVGGDNLGRLTASRIWDRGW
ncbi:hypothetical protein [Mangrovitalea sediminis]|uniref:hypothetical protein n=1 Tax=Mangrovitalea sediminis TaxID=1982043 RepID=UPI000BE5400C|nr:hypothetical protein [Mangrovitalea sediminis]